MLTPPDSHVDVALEALSLGCHVLVEKPLATSVEDCDRLIAESQARGLRVCVNHSLLGDPLVKRALALVKTGAIGDVLTVDYLRSSNYPPYRGGPLPPQYREGGYQFRDLGVHALYLMREFLGAIEDVHAEFRRSGVKGQRPKHLISTNGVHWCVVRRAPETSSFPGTSSHCSINSIIQGTRGTLRADLFAMYSDTSPPYAIAESRRARHQRAGRVYFIGDPTVVERQLDLLLVGFSRIRDCTILSLRFTNRSPRTV